MLEALAGFVRQGIRVTSVKEGTAMHDCVHVGGSVSDDQRPAMESIRRSQSTFGYSH